MNFIQTSQAPIIGGTDHRRRRSSEAPITDVEASIGGSVTVATATTTTTATIAPTATSTSHALIGGRDLCKVAIKALAIAVEVAVVILR